jgi:membrane protein DedA with SNARE-associated domain
MCTVTWLMHADSYAVFFNRDELKTRSRALPPAIKKQNGVRHIAPVDLESFFNPALCWRQKRCFQHDIIVVTGNLSHCYKFHDMNLTIGKKRWHFWTLVAYFILLALSHLVRLNRSAEAPLTSDKKSLRVKAVDGEARTEQEIQLAYREFKPAANDSLPVLILLHGSPMKSGIGLIVFMMLIAAATLVSEDLTCIGAGLMIARDTIGFVPGTLACFLGIYFGDLILFWAGRWLGRAAVSRPPLKWLISEDDIQKSTAWFNRRGPQIILFSRFLPGSRLPAYFTAGVLRTSFWSFSLFFLLAAAIWTPLLVGAAVFIGEAAFALLANYQKYAIASAVGVLIGVHVILKFVLPLFSYKGRRLLLSKYRRLTRWEFWPLWVFYIPIVVYILYLGLKHRSLTLFTAANPSIPESGFIGESKAEILCGLTSANGFVARHILIKSSLPAAARLKQVHEFMAANHLTLPIVIKPDKGQRGAGVTIARSQQQLEECLAKANFDVIVQEYVDGHEFGIFYVRYPHKANGFIYSITDKKLISVVGDGRRTLEELILDDDRAVCMARLHLQKHEKNLYHIPPKGETVKLVEVGTHCRGALFLNGAAIKTKELEAKIDEFSKGFSGFYFGRYDIRTPSVADIKNGTGFKVVELNGVTSEATHIYDPANSLWEGYRVLMNQWRMAFEIGARNRKMGVEPVSVRHLFRLLREKNSEQ